MRNRFAVVGCTVALMALILLPRVTPAMRGAAIPRDIATESGYIPSPQLRTIHWTRPASDAGVNLFIQVARTTSQITPPPTDGEAARGKAIFERRCIGCHSLDQNREGPRLRGVFGRMSGSLPDYAYSSAIKQAHITWNETTLERWLADPDTLIPGNNMEFHVAKPQERSDLIRFLKESANK